MSAAEVPGVDEVAFDMSDLPTLQKMADVYTRLAERETDPGGAMVNRIVAQVTRALAALLIEKAAE